MGSGAGLAGGGTAPRPRLRVVAGRFGASLLACRAPPRLAVWCSLCGGSGASPCGRRRAGRRSGGLRADPRRGAKSGVGVWGGRFEGVGRLVPGPRSASGRGYRPRRGLVRRGRPLRVAGGGCWSRSRPAVRRGAPRLVLAVFLVRRGSEGAGGRLVCSLPAAASFQLSAVLAARKGQAYRLAALGPLRAAVVRSLRSPALRFKGRAAGAWCVGPVVGPLGVLAVVSSPVRLRLCSFVWSFGCGVCGGVPGPCWLAFLRWLSGRWGFALVPGWPLAGWLGAVCRFWLAALAVVALGLLVGARLGLWLAALAGR